MYNQYELVQYIELEVYSAEVQCKFYSIYVFSGSHFSLKFTDLLSAHLAV